ncbi:hypothetical protein CN918_27705 [Priestia megaterium]|nr:hypothetical protein CN918_27705 [Priestia megaterium]
MKKIMPDTVKNVKAKLEFETGRTVKELGEVFNYAKGTYIKLDDSQKGIIQIRLNGVKVGSGKLLTKKGELYVQIIDLKRK